MSTAKILKDYINQNGIKRSFIAKKVGMPVELLRRSLDGERILKADEFIAICMLLSLDFKHFTSNIGNISE